MRAWLSSKFGQIRLLLSMATDRVIMEKGFTVFFLDCFLSDPFKLEGNDDMHESSEEFEWIYGLFATWFFAGSPFRTYD